MSVITHGPDWFFRSSHDRFIAWRVDASGDPVTSEGTVDTRMVLPLAYEEPGGETLVTALGTVEDVATSRALAPEIVSGPDIGRLRAWKGERIVARLLTGGRGRHIVWDEPVPVRLKAFSRGRPSLEGDRLEMESHLFAPAVTLTPDLLDGGTWEPATGDEETVTITLPAPSLRVFGFFPAPYAEGGAHMEGDITIEALAADGTTVLGSDVNGLPGLVLPAGTWFVRVTAEPVDGVYPVLTTYGASPAVGVGGYLLLGEDADTYTLGAYGLGTVTDGPSQVVTMAGETLTIETYTLGTPEIAAARTRDNGDGTITVSTTTLPL